MSKKGTGKLLAGLGLGVGLGMLFAPKKGSALRQDLKTKLDELIAKTKEVDLDEVRDEFFKKVDEVKKELEDLDKEKVLKIAKEKSEILKNKAEDLVKLAKDKGTPILENVAKDVKAKTVLVAKDVIKKLEEPKE